jgi:hypothetical protein
MRAGPQDWRIVGPDKKGLNNPGGSPLSFGDEKGAMTAMKDLQGTKIHSLDINPALRKGATEEGFPQFASGGQVKPSQSRLTPVAHNPFEVQNAIRRAIHANRSA